MGYVDEWCCGRDGRRDGGRREKWSASLGRGGSCMVAAFFSLCCTKTKEHASIRCSEMARVGTIPLQFPYNSLKSFNFYSFFFFLIYGFAAFIFGYLRLFSLDYCSAVRRILRYRISYHY